MQALDQQLSLWPSGQSARHVAWMQVTLCATKMPSHRCMPPLQAAVMHEMVPLHDRLSCGMFSSEKDLDGTCHVHTAASHSLCWPQP